MNELSQLLRWHRSIRRYLPTLIDPALTAEVCDDAIAGGSSSGNLSSISIALAPDAERRRRLYELHLEQPMSIPAIKAEIEAAGIPSLAQYYTSKIKYDPDYFVPQSAEIRALLERQGFWN